jgi:glycosyl transferase family 1
MRFAVVTPDPARWVHVRAFDEVAEVIHAGLIELGLACERSVARLLDGRTNIVFGAHLLPAETVLPSDAILYNLEQIVDGSMWVTPSYLERLRRHRVWDYSARNCAALRGLGVSAAQHVPLGHAAVLERIAPAGEDIDVLFYGVYNARRLAVLRRLSERGLKVFHASGVYGAERDALVARARIALNVHFYPESRLEVPRCFYLMANGRFVLSEASPDAGETGLAGGMALVSYENLEESCVRYLERPQERAAIAEAGRAILRKRPQSALLASALGYPR